ncbi:MAG: hypothetical protein ACLUD2_06575 [Clostridium sp.]
MARRLGSRIRLKDLLYSLMLESHNDSAVAIAEHIGWQRKRPSHGKDESQGTGYCAAVDTRS